MVKGNIGTVEVVLNPTTDIQTFFLRDLERQDRTPAEEARWLSHAEQIQTWRQISTRTRSSSTHSAVWVSRLLASEAVPCRSASYPDRAQRSRG